MSSTNQNILVIDPNTINSKLIQSLLEKKGFAVTSIDSINHVNDQNYHLIITDIEYLGQLNTETPILYMSDASQNAAEAVAQDFLLTRPIAPQDLFSKIAKALPQGNAPKHDVKNTPSSADTTHSSQIMQNLFDVTTDLIRNTAEGPFAAIITKGSNIIATETDHIIRDNDPTAKAALRAIRTACTKANTQDLSGCNIYLTCEPCALCLAAIYTARLDRIYFANTLTDLAEAGFDDLEVFDEIRERPEKRRMPSTMLEHEEGKIVLNEWAQQQN